MVSPSVSVGVTPPLASPGTPFASMVPSACPSSSTSGESASIESKIPSLSESGSRLSASPSPSVSVAPSPSTVSKIPSLSSSRSVSFGMVSPSASSQSASWMSGSCAAPSCCPPSASTGTPLVSISPERASPASRFPRK